MTLAVLVLTLLITPAAGASPQAGVHDRGIAAESAGRWHDALAIYLTDLARDPQQADLWLRVADINARLGHGKEVVRALARAAAASPGTAAIHLRLSQAYAEAGERDAALDAIERAVALEPRSPEYLRRRAVLATWANAYGPAKESYRRLMQLEPADADAVLGFARVSAWSGATDSAVTHYRKYLRLRPDARDVWIELARAEAWRGNFAEAIDVLDAYRDRFGESPDAARERAAVLARGGRPREATRLIDALPAAPSDYDLNSSRAVALAAQHRRGAALSALDTVYQLGPARPETGDVRDLVRVTLASTGAPGGSFYSDSDGLRTWRFDPRLSLALAGDLRVDAGYDRTELRARTGSGLEQPGGTLDARHELTYVGLSLRGGPLTLRGQTGYAQLGDRDRTAYLVSAQFASDRLEISATRETGYFVVSPRTVGLGLTRVTHRAGLDWAPSMRYHLTLDGTYDELSDGNRRWDVSLAPRRAVARTQRLNLDLGLHARHFGTTRDLDHGYYDPSRYESYSLVAFPYFKLHENVGLGGVVGLGIQRDTSARSFSLAQNASFEATFGIFRDWMLKVNGSMTINDRLQTGAFRGYGGRVVLVRRF